MLVTIKLEVLCELCNGNRIKSMTGDAADCNTDTACDGITKVPNSVRTTCGKNVTSGVF